MCGKFKFGGEFNVDEFIDCECNFCLNVYIYGRGYVLCWKEIFGD